MQPGTRGQNSQGSRPPVARPRLVGPCYRCAEWGHLVENGLKPKQLYPFTQPLVSKAAESFNNSHSVCADSSTSHVVCVNTTDHKYSFKTRGSCLSHEGVDNKKAVAQSKAAKQESLTDFKKVNTQRVANDPELPELDIDLEGSGELLEAQCWEVQVEELVPQIVYVQGRFRQNLNFWQHTLQAPNNVMEWIQRGYMFPVQYLLWTPLAKVITIQPSCTNHLLMRLLQNC